MSRLHSFFFWVGGALIGTMILLLCAAALLVTPLGQPVLLHLIAWSFSSPQRQFQFDVAEGSSLSDLRLTSVSLADSKGVWAQAQGAHLVWEPAALFLKRQVKIDTFRLKHLVILRRPSSSDEAALTLSQKASISDFIPHPFLLLPPLPILLKELKLDSVEIEEGFIKKESLAARFALRGRFDLPARRETRPLAAWLHLQSVQKNKKFAFNSQEIAESGEGVSLNLAFDPLAETLQVEMRGFEEKGGLLAQFLDLPETPALEFHLSGTGPLRGWKGKIETSANGIPIIQGNLTHLPPSQAGEAGGMHLTLEAELGKVVPVSLRPFLKERLELEAQAALFSSGAVALSAFRLMSQFGSFSATAQLSAEGRLDSLRFAGNLAELSAEFKATSPLPESLITLLERSRFSGHLIQEGGMFIPNNSWQFELKTAALALFGQGNFQKERLDGEVQLSVPAVEVLPFPTDQQPFRGALMVSLKGEGSWDGQDFSMELTTPKTEVRLRDVSEPLPLPTLPTLRVLGTHPRLEGRVSRHAGGPLLIEEMRLRSESFEGQISGTAESEALDLNLSAELAEGQPLFASLSGALQLEGRVQGKLAQPLWEGKVTSPELRLNNALLSEFALLGRGGGEAGPKSADFSLSARFEGKDLEGTAEIAPSDAIPDGISLQEIKLVHAEAFEMTGSLERKPAQVFSGALSINGSDLHPLGLLLGKEIGGAGRLSLNLFEEPGGGQGGTLKGELSDALLGGVGSLDQASFEGEGHDLLRMPLIEGKLQASDVTLRGQQISALTLQATSRNQTTQLNLEARRERALLTSRLALTRSATDLQIVLEEMVLRSREISTEPPVTARLHQPVQIRFEPGQKNPWHFPMLSWDIHQEVEAATAAPSKRGVVTLSGTPPSPMVFSLKKVPATILEMLFPTKGLRGDVSGTITVHPTAHLMDLPRAVWTISGENMGFLSFEQNGFPPLVLVVTGALVGNEARYQGTLTERYTPDLHATALRFEGQAHLLKKTQNTSFSGNLSLASVESAGKLAERGTQIAGLLSVQGRAYGPWVTPQLSGTATLERGRIQDPRSGITLSEVRLALRAEGSRLTFTEAVGQTDMGGQITMTGFIDLLPRENFPANLAFTITRGHLERPQLFDAKGSAHLTLTGALTGTPLLKGVVTISRMEIILPEQLPGSVFMLDVLHKNAPPFILAQEAASEERAQRQAAGAKQINLDITLNSDGMIFVTGRGLSAELGGSMILTGKADAPQTVGAFTLRRGQFVFLGRSLSFEHGRITFTGNLDPELDFLARTTVRGTTISVGLTGQVRNPHLSFSSTPALPEDEMLSLLFFGRSLETLSPLQVAALASEMSSLTGRGPGVLGRLRQGLGIDMLNILTDSEGQTEVELGKYINKRVYFGLQQGTETGSSGVQIQLDLTDHIRVQGEANTGGEGRLGIELNYDY